MTALQTILRLTITLVVTTLSTLACTQDKAPAQDKPPTQLKVYSAGIVHETNTFSPVPTDLGDFAVTWKQDFAGPEAEVPLFECFLLWRDCTLQISLDPFG